VPVCAVTARLLPFCDVSCSRSHFLFAFLPHATTTLPAYKLPLHNYADCIARHRLTLFSTIVPPRKVLHAHYAYPYGKRQLFGSLFTPVMVADKVAAMLVVCWFIFSRHHLFRLVQFTTWMLRTLPYPTFACLHLPAPGLFFFRGLSIWLRGPHTGMHTLQQLPAHHTTVPAP